MVTREIHPIDDTAAVLGTSRSDGNTRLLLDYVLDSRPIRVMDLSTMAMSYYDYANANSGDDFLPLIETLAGKSLWLLATPVYWYSMSAQMKVFFDRLNDVITIRKDLGRRLRGKSVAVVASGTERQLPEGFESPFRLTCGYLGMHYLNAHYEQFGESRTPPAEARAKAAGFGAMLFDAPGEK